MTKSLCEFNRLVSLRAKWSPISVEFELLSSKLFLYYPGAKCLTPFSKLHTGQPLVIIPRSLPTKVARVWDRPPFSGMDQEEHFQPGAANQHAMAELTTSTLFPKLPPEMRLRVWKQVLPIRPQIIKVGKCCVCPTIGCYWHKAHN
jgi:hypothetical protein